LASESRPVECLAVAVQIWKQYEAFGIDLVFGDMPACGTVLFDWTFDKFDLRDLMDCIDAHEAAV